MWGNTVRINSISCKFFLVSLTCLFGSTDTQLVMSLRLYIYIRLIIIAILIFYSKSILIRPLEINRNCTNNLLIFIPPKIGTMAKFLSNIVKDKYLICFMNRIVTMWEYTGKLFKSPHISHNN